MKVSTSLVSHISPKLTMILWLDRRISTIAPNRHSAKKIPFANSSRL